MFEASAELSQALLDALGKPRMHRLLLLAAFHRAAPHERLLAVGSGAELGLHSRAHALPVVGLGDRARPLAQFAFGCVPSGNGVRSAGATQGSRRWSCRDPSPRCAGPARSALPSARRSLPQYRNIHSIQRVGEELPRTILTHDKETNLVDCRDDGLTIDEKTVLDTIDALGGEPKQDDVLKRAGIKRANGIGVLKRLEQRGTILRFGKPMQIRRI